MTESELPPHLYEGKPCQSCLGTIRYRKNNACQPCAIKHLAKWREANPTYFRDRRQMMREAKND